MSKLTCKHEWIWHRGVILRGVTAGPDVSRLGELGNAQVENKGRGVKFIKCTIINLTAFDVVVDLQPNRGAELGT